MWKRRWFVLRNGELFYYKSQVSKGIHLYSKAENSYYYYCFIRKGDGFRMCITKIFSSILQHDVLRKPQGTISLDEQTRIDNTKGETSFQVNNNPYRLM